PDTPQTPLDPPSPAPHHGPRTVPRRRLPPGDEPGMRSRGSIQGPEAAAAPATVSGERPHPPLAPIGPGRPRRATTRQPGDRPCDEVQPPVGDDGQGDVT